MRPVHSAKDPIDVASLNGEALPLFRLSNPKTAEHVLQDGLGGRVVLKDDVCGNCNTSVFAALDGHLIRYVHECLFHDHPDVVSKRTVLSQGMHHWFDEKLSAWMTVRVDANLKAHLFDQLVFVGGALLGFSGDPAIKRSAHARAQEMFEELSQYSSLHFSDLVIPGEVPPVGPAIVRSKPNHYVLRGATQAAVDELRELVKDGLSRPKEPTPTETTATKTPHIKVRLAFHPEQMDRAIAKTALNFLCHAWGPGVARQERFDGVREFALRGAAGLFSPVKLVEKPADEEKLALFCKPDHHAIVLCASEGLGVFAQLVLYQRSVATVQLCATTDEMDWIAGVFNYKTGRHRIVTEDEDNVSFTA